ncbi:MAG: hypothetical protein LBM02_03710 [Lachnospiraceae bacterium]|jgi:uncharacterized repeat protein (TIGR01451 family)|nr:hypothetical protein [Lachnospiraceae bacterium]
MKKIIQRTISLFVIVGMIVTTMLGNEKLSFAEGANGETTVKSQTTAGSSSSKDEQKDSVTSTDTQNDSTVKKDTTSEEKTNTTSLDTTDEEKTNTTISESTLNKSLKSVVETKDGFDILPTSKADVYAAINKYKNELKLNKDTAVKPHWQEAISVLYIPDGYELKHVTDDETFGQEYYTFAKEENDYDIQPTSLEEVTSVINEYFDKFIAALDKGDLEKAVSYEKPHFKYDIPKEFIPRGYNFKKITNDEDFKEPYYTCYMGSQTLYPKWQNSRRSLTRDFYTSGLGTSEDNPYLISNYDDLKELSNEVAAGNTFEGYYFRVTADIDLSGDSNWIPIGNSEEELSDDYEIGSRSDPLYDAEEARPFMGSFDGANHIISNMTIAKAKSNELGDYNGLFGFLYNGSIKNVEIDGASVTGCSGTAVLLGHGRDSVNITGCTVKNSTVNCNKDSGNYGVSGLVGIIRSEKSDVVNIKDILIDNTNVTSTANDGSTGGVIGKISVIEDESEELTKINIENCIFKNGNVTAEDNLCGGLIGELNNKGVKNNEISIKNNSFDNVNVSITSSGEYVGGFIGQLNNEDAESNNVIINNSNLNKVNVSSTSGGDNVGGMIGAISSKNSTKLNISIENVKATEGIIKGVGGGDNVGGLIGYIDNDGTTYSNVGVKECTVSNEDVSNNGSFSYQLGGAIACIENHGNASNNVVNVESITTDKVNVTANKDSSYYDGGVIGYIHDTSKYNTTNVINCHAKGKGVYVLAKDSLSYYVGGLLGFYWNDSNGGKERSNLLNVIGCSSEVDVKTLSGSCYYIGGLIGHIGYGGYIKNSWATGDVYSGGEKTGGLIGCVLRSQGGAPITIENCYAMGNIYNQDGLYASSGGFIGYTDPIVITNCYATGSAYAKVGEAMYGVGSFIGTHFSGIADVDPLKITNCYTTGKPQFYSSTTTNVGAFIGYMWGSKNPIFTNCFYDTTTTGLSSNKTFGDRSGAYSGVTALTTGHDYQVELANKKGTDPSNAPTGMINIESFSAWNIKDNLNGKATKNGATGGSESDPWYIDDKVTYPYLWYQYDGLDADGDGTLDYKPTKEDVDYKLATEQYNFTDGSVTDRYVTPRFDDFLIDKAGTNQSTNYDVRTAGADRVYFPYLGYTYSFNGEKKIRVGDETTLRIDGAKVGNHTVANNSTPYSMGGISKSNIVAFDPMPFAEKTNDTYKKSENPDKEELNTYEAGNVVTYTKRGDLIEYTITITNPNFHKEWLGVTLTDYLPKGVNLITGVYNNKLYKVTVSKDGTEEEIHKTDSTLPDIGPETATTMAYTYTKATNENETDSDLKIYLGNMDAAHVNEDDNSIIMHKWVVKFTVMPDRRAISHFPLNDPANIALNGNNIENTGIVSGTIKEIYGTDAEKEQSKFDYTTDFDDKDKDPIFDSYKVSYIGNGGKTAIGGDTYNDYYLFEDGFTVRDNSDASTSSTPNDFEYLWRYHKFKGDYWYSKPTLEKTSTHLYNFGDSGVEDGCALVNNENPIADGNRISEDKIDNPYSDYYYKTDFKLYSPWIPETGSITIIKKNEDGDTLEGARFLLEKQNEDGTYTPIKWNSTSKEWVTTTDGYSGETDENGKLVFGKENTSASNPNADDTLPLLTNYRLTEVKAPTINDKSYSLLKDPILIRLPYEIKKDDDSSSNTPSLTYKDDNEEYINSYFDLTYTITDVQSFELPSSGNKGLPIYIYLAALAIILASTTYLVRYYRRKKGLIKKH